MSSLLTILAPIALLDSTSMIPIAVLPMAVMLSGSRPYLSSLSFLAGIFITYTTGGVLLLTGLEVLLGFIQPFVAGFLHAPTDIELAIQLALGLIMVGFGWKMADARQSKGERGADSAMSPGQSFVLGATLILVGLPGALPYFGAVDQILRSDLSVAQSIAMLLFYNVVFLLPHVTLILVKVVAPGQSAEIFAAVAGFFERWGRRIIICILLIVGAVLVADAIGWWMGNPLLPVFPAAGT